MVKVFYSKWPSKTDALWLVHTVVEVDGDRPISSQLTSTPLWTRVCLFAKTTTDQDQV